MSSLMQRETEKNTVYNRFFPFFSYFGDRERKSGEMPTQLTQEEIDSCRDAFLQYDKDRSGSIDQWELKEVLEGNFFFFSKNITDEFT